MKKTIGNIAILFMKKTVYVIPGRGDSVVEFRIQAEAMTVYQDSKDICKKDWFGSILLFEESLRCISTTRLLVYIV